MTIGFTGTQRGMTELQKSEVLRYLTGSLSPSPEAHAGDCIGADAEFQRMAWVHGYRVVLHPPSDPKKRAFYYAGGVILLPEKPYRERNQDIVDACHVLLAAPSGPEEMSPRSGTWMTVRMARRAKKQVVIFPPQGGIEIE